MTHSDDILRKKLSFRAWHRGTREADLLMGRYADAFLPTASQEDLTAFDLLLAEQDPDIYDWLTRQKPLPAGVFKPVLENMMAFYFKTVSHD